jgi:hypothetical protein
MNQITNIIVLSACLLLFHCSSAEAGQCNCTRYSRAYNSLTIHQCGNICYQMGYEYTYYNDGCCLCADCLDWSCQCGSGPIQTKQVVIVQRQENTTANEQPKPKDSAIDGQPNPDIKPEIRTDVKSDAGDQECNKKKRPFRLL